jgi:hypothetical protein
VIAVRCRHGKSWLLVGGLLEWCPDCGAIRQLRPSAEQPNVSVPYWSGYCYPRGNGLALRRLEQVDPMWKRRRP